MITREDDVSVLFLNVGQGHATLFIDHALGRAILVDCPANAEDVVEAALTSGGASLDTAVITHFDTDHSSGVAALLSRLSFPRLILHPDTGSPTIANRAEARQILSHHKRTGGLIVNAVSGSVGRMTWSILGPSSAIALAGNQLKDRNRTSLCISIRIDPSSSTGTPRRVLITGDADGPAWTDMLKRGADVGCDFMLWPHHGASIGRPGSAQSQKAVAAANPNLVVISAGTGNSHGHPSRTSIAAVRSIGSRVICTQVTARCHALLPGGSQTACGGTVAVRIDKAGRYSVSPSVEAHATVVAGWSTPLCV